MLNIAVLVSGGGTNLQALIDAEKRGEIPGGKLALVLASKPGVFALERARRAGIPTSVLVRKEFPTQQEYDQALLARLDEAHIDLIILAGFLTIISGDVVRRYENRIINVHPSLIPSFCGEGFYGLRVHEEALRRGVKVTGATVHFVTDVCDGGPIILQQAVAVKEGDTPETLQRRVMEEAEWKLLPKAAALFCAGKLTVDGAVVHCKEDACMKTKDLRAEAGSTSYPGRGIVLGRSEDGKKAVAAYFIMGRSENSRNRVFEAEGDGLKTRAFDESKMQDPSLVIYNAVRVWKDETIVTNGDQTDTIYDFLAAGKTWEEALRTRTFEPDAPNFTPRISGVVCNKTGAYRLSILKSCAQDPESVQRFFYEYPQPRAGEGHFLHTYMSDGNPLPSYEGEPAPVAIRGGLQEFTETLWQALNEENKISLFVRFIDLETGAWETEIRNKNQ